MRVLRIQTDNGSTYLVGPSPSVPGRVRIARLSDHSVRGAWGPTSFAVDVPTAELVADGALLRLRWTEDDGVGVQTSAVQDVATWSSSDLTTTPA